MTDWNLRYLAYAKAHHVDDPVEMMRRDSAAWPGGKMAGFQIWMSQQWQAWRKLRGVGRDDFIDIKQHADFDAWLSSGGGSS